MKRGMFSGSGTSAAATSFVGPEAGVTVCTSMSWTNDAAGTLKFYRAKQKTTANAACSASTTLVIDTDSAGKVGGAVLTTNDFVLIEDSSGTGWQKRTLASVGAVSSSTVSLTLGATATCADGDRIWIVRAADVPTITLAAATVQDMGPLWNSYPNMPVYVEQNSDATGSHYHCGVYEVEKDFS